MLQTSICKDIFAFMDDRIGFDPKRDQLLDVRGLRALTHPLRLQLLGLLRQDGPSTATRLAAQTGHSSGLTSYHLRQLEEARLVTDAQGLGVGRERWWKAAARSHWFDLDSADPELGEQYQRTVVHRLANNAENWVNEQRLWPEPWRRAADLSDWVLELTAEEALELKKELAELVVRYRRAGSGGQRVSVQVQLFPLGDPTSVEGDLATQELSGPKSQEHK